jgi:hypothetical protein
MLKKLKVNFFLLVRQLEKERKKERSWKLIMTINKKKITKLNIVYIGDKKHARISTSIIFHGNGYQGFTYSLIMNYLQSIYEHNSHPPLCGLL